MLFHYSVAIIHEELQNIYMWWAHTQHNFVQVLSDENLGISLGCFTYNQNIDMQIGR